MTANDNILVSLLDGDDFYASSVGALAGSFITFYLPNGGKRVVNKDSIRDLEYPPTKVGEMEEKLVGTASLTIESGGCVGTEGEYPLFDAFLNAPVPTPTWVGQYLVQSHTTGQPAPSEHGL